MASLITSLFQTSSILSSGKSLISGGNKTKIGELVIDASLNEVITNSSNITEHPIETKEAISDHIFKKPLKIKLEGYITDSPIRLMGLFETPLQNNSLDKFIGNVKTYLPFNAAAKPSLQAYQLLKKLYEDRQLIEVVTKLDAFKNMAIETIDFTCDKDTGERLEFTAGLVQVNFASVTTTLNTNYKNSNIQSLVQEKINVGISDKGTSVSTTIVDKAKGLVKDGVQAVGNFLFGG